MTTKVVLAVFATLLSYAMLVSSAAAQHVWLSCDITHYWTGYGEMRGQTKPARKETTIYVIGTSSNTVSQYIPVNKTLEGGYVATITPGAFEWSYTITGTSAVVKSSIDRFTGDYQSMGKITYSGSDGWIITQRVGECKKTEAQPVAGPKF